MYTSTITSIYAYICMRAATLSARCFGIVTFLTSISAHYSYLYFYLLDLRTLCLDSNCERRHNVDSVAFRYSFVFRIVHIRIRLPVIVDEHQFFFSIELSFRLGTSLELICFHRLDVRHSHECGGCHTFVMFCMHTMRAALIFSYCAPLLNAFTNQYYNAIQCNCAFNEIYRNKWFCFTCICSTYDNSDFTKKKHDDDNKDDDNDDGISHANTCSAPKFNLMIEIAMIVICFDANLRNCTMYIQIHSNLSFASTIGGFFSRFIHFFVDHRFQWVRIWVTLNLNSFNFN